MDDIARGDLAMFFSILDLIFKKSTSIMIVWNEVGRLVVRRCRHR